MAKSRPIRRGWAALGLAVFALTAACGGSATGNSGEATGATGAAGGATGAGTAAGPLYIYLTNDPIGVNKFLESGKTGVEAAAAQFGGQAKVYEGQDETSMRQNMEAAIEEQPDVIVTITFDFTDITKEFAERYPDQTFVLIDDCPAEGQPANMYCAVFREHEAAYLLGAEAGLLTKTNQTGSVGAVDIPFIHRYTDAFAQGSAEQNPKVKDSQLFIGGQNPFSDPARAKEQAAAMAATGTDHIFAVASGSNGGVFEAAAAAGVTAYGVDVNQCPDQVGAVGDGTLKLMDTLIPDLIGKIQKGEAGPVNSYGLAEGGMDIVSLHEGASASLCTVMDHPDVLAVLTTLKDKVIAGEITPVDPTGLN
ncbi:MAG: BMP family ABC transporter substrate-binding protein [Bifidobacteriaceae bacterium]|jgi:basic membrane protein A|nr:BMP family ABC transporter substrate-binding protein [Bifidobacteriaceae bacterium]